MRISKTIKTLLSMVVVSGIAISAVGCSTTKKSADEQKQGKVEVQISLENGVEITEPFAHILSLEGIPEDATPANTFIMPTNITPRIKAKSLDSNVELDYTRFKDKAGNILKLYEDQILLPLENYQKVKITLESEDEKIVVPMYTIIFDTPLLKSNKIYLIPKEIEDFFTPADLKRIEEAKKSAEGTETTETTEETEVTETTEETDETEESEEPEE